MKKNAMLKIAAVLLVAVLLTTCAISSTFAKYTSRIGAHNETARVAKWGIEVETANFAEGALFQKSYEDNDVVAETIEGKQDNVVAPGTSGSLTLNFKVSGKAEVKSKIVLDDGDSNPATNYYLKANFPAGTVEWSLNGQFNDNMTPELINAEIDKFIENYAGTLEANKSINIDKDLTIYWRWLYEDTSLNSTEQAEEDKDDTAAGQAQAGVNGLSGNYTATFSLTADIVQVGDNDAN